MLDIFSQPTSEMQQTASNNNGGSDRPLDKPLGWAMGALRWSPKPSAAALTSVATTSQHVVHLRALLLAVKDARNWAGRPTPYPNRRPVESAPTHRACHKSAWEKTNELLRRPSLS
jgi:hypothetical protein